MSGHITTAGLNRYDALGSDIAAAAIVVSPGPGWLRGVLVVTANSTNAIKITDGVGGPVIGIVAASAAAGTIYEFDMRAYTSINIPQTTGAGNLAISYD